MVTTLLLSVHLLAVMAAFGASVSIGRGVARVFASPGPGEPLLGRLAFVLDGAAELEARVIGPGYALGGLTGAVLVQRMGIPWDTLWVVVALGLFAVSTALARGVLGPTSARLRAVVRSELAAGALVPGAEATRLMGRVRRLATVLSCLSVAMTVLMAWKPI